jgi:hypothetical protein
MKYREESRDSKGWCQQQKLFMSTFTPIPRDEETGKLFIEK